ncbi:MAG: DUF1257 domain-containing protein [Elusimicrobia bacterium]|nr:DUF1257 domain-containing protein [Elusimicrobiota bacterium]
MSAGTDVQITLQDIEEFCGALADLGRGIANLFSLTTSDGQKHRVEGVFDDGVGRKAGIKKTDKGFCIVRDCKGLNPAELAAQDKSIKQVVQRYSYRKVVKQLQSRGYTVAEEKKQADGAIRVVARKWGT